MTDRSPSVVTCVPSMKPKRTILCVDDNEQSLSIRKVMLETRGYRVLTSHNGREALDILRRGGIDLLLTDLMMPEVDGNELIRQAKEFSPFTPAILFSGHTKFCSGDTCADLFLPKGAHAPIELLERIRLMLVRKRGPKRSVITPEVGLDAPQPLRTGTA